MTTAARSSKTSTLVVIKFDNEAGADRMREELGRLQKEELIKLDDAAVVVRRADGKVKVKQATSLVGAGALGGAFWGMLIGLLFFAPWLGLAIGAGAGALAASMQDIGVDDSFIKQVGASIQPGNSALFVLVREATTDRVLEELKPYGGEIIHTNLSSEDEARLKAAFGAEEA
jgi:uncharacterized membrane protein